MRAPQLTPWLDGFLAVRLMSAGAVARRELDRVCKQGGRPLREVLVLAVVSHTEMGQAAVADRLGLQRAELSRIAADLRDEGWVDRAASRYDSRTQVLRPSPGAAKIVRAAEPGFRLVDRRLRSNLTRLRQEQLTSGLEALKGPSSPVWDALTAV